VEILLKRVRQAVVIETDGAQVPWESSSLTGDFCFRTTSGGVCSVGR
jgi:carboxyl-terminal processing protease